MSGDNVYQDADIVWVKLGSSWWPGEVCGLQRQPEGFIQQAKRKPYCVVKFFQEDSFECVKTSKHILPFNCSKKEEFIRKGHELFKAKKKFMEKFPSDVSTAERLTRSVTRSSLFFNSRPDSIVKAILGESPHQGDYNRNGKRCDNVTKIINITPTQSFVASPASSSPPIYKCSMCDFQSTRQNVMVLHRKSHTGTTTASRTNSLISSATMTPSKESEARYSGSSSRTVAVGTSSPLPNTINCQTPVRRRISIAPLNDTILDVVDDSDNSSDDQNQYDVPAELKAKQQPHISTTEQSSSPPQAVENVDTETICKENTSKSEEIQKSLLADWFDEDKDDDEDDRHQDKVQQYPSVAVELPQVSLKAPVSIAVEPIMQKPSPKIRNIPKKDRRNIVFTDFNSSDEIINLDASSQKSCEDTRQLEKSLREGLLPAIENSRVKTCVVEASIFEPHTSGAKIVAESPPPVESSAARPSTPFNTHFFEDDPSLSARESSDVDEGVYLPQTVESSSTDALVSEEVAEKSHIQESFDTDFGMENVFEEEAFQEDPAEQEAVEEKAAEEKAAEEEAAEEEAVGEEAVGEETVGEEAVGEETVGEETVGEETVGEEAVEEEAVEEEAVEEEAVGEETVGGETVGAETVGAETVGEKAVGEETVEEEAVEEEPITRESETVERPVEELTVVTPSKEKSPETVEFSLTVESSPLTVEAEPTVVSSTVDKEEEAPAKRTPRVKTPRKRKSTRRISRVKRTVRPSSPWSNKIIKESSSVESPILPNEQSEMEPCTRKQLHSPEASENNETPQTEQSVVQESTVEPSDEGSVKPDIGEVRDIPLAVEESPEEPAAEESYTNLPVQEPEEPPLKNEYAMELSSEPAEMRESALENADILSNSEEQPVGGISAVEPSTKETCEELPAEENVPTVEPSNEQVFEAEPPDEDRDTMNPCSKKSHTAGQPLVESTNVPDTLEEKKEDVKSLHSVSKNSLSCFDFQEEDDADDILTSIAKFKKKYISPEKSYDFVRDSRPKTPDAQKLEMELKDNQLSAEIESLLSTTQVTVELATPSHVKQEVRTLPIKERGKRIFKSRNRNRVDSCSSVSTTSTVKVATQSSTAPESADCNITESCLPSNNAEHSSKPDKMDLVTDEMCSQKQVSDEVENAPRRNEEAMDDKVTNSEEVIVGRIVFSPSEVYAPLAESSQSPDNRESHVSSSSIVVRTDAIDEGGYANQSKPSDDDFAAFGVVVAENESQQADYTYSIPRVDDEEMSLQQDVQREHNLEEVARVEVQTESAHRIFSLPHVQQEVVENHLNEAGVEQEAEKGNHLEDSSIVVAESQTRHEDSGDIKEGNPSENTLPHPETENIIDEEAGEQRGEQLVAIGDLMSENHPEYTVSQSESEQPLQVDHLLEDDIAERQTTQHVLDTSVMEEGNHPEYCQIESSVDKEVPLEEESQRETYLNEIAITATEQEAHSADYPNVDEGAQVIAAPLETEHEIASQEFPQPEDDQLNEFFVVEESEPVYEVEVYDAEGSSKPSENNYEESNTEYELITTEVTSIVDRMSNDEEANVSGENTLENFKSGSVPEVSEVVVRSTDEGHYFKEIGQANSDQKPLSTTDANGAELQVSTTSDGVGNNGQYFVVATAVPDNEGPSDESNSLLPTNQCKSSVHEKDVRVEALEDESIPAGEGSIPGETSSDETVISDAEAEFGSPTSMLEEERMLSRCRSESMTPVTNMEFVTNNPKSKPTKENVLKKTPRWTRSQLLGCREDRRLVVQSLQYDTQESASNDVEQNSTNKVGQEKEDEIPERRFSKTGIFTNEKQTMESEVGAPDGGAEPASNKEDTQDSATESESDEEEISSPPIEPLQDESGDSETFEPCSTTDSGPGDSVKSGKGANQCGKEAETRNENETKTQPPTNSDVENSSSNQSPATFGDQISNMAGNHEPESQTSASYSSEDKEATNQTSKSSFYTITQKSETIIRLNKFSKGASAAVVHGNKPEIDGEELSAAEALLLIPNQPSNVFDSHESPQTQSVVPDGSPSAEENTDLSIMNQIKDEPTENDPVAEVPKEIVRRKRRSHMKVTPRKHIADVQKTEAELPHAKIPKLSQEPKFPIARRKTFAEQYEENFVLKYMKDQSMGEADSVGSSNSATPDSAKSPAPIEKQTPEKVHISVDISNPLSSQIASILGTNRSVVEEDCKLGGARKRKQTLEDDIPSFIIKRPSPKTVAEAEAADRETIAQIQTLCPHVEITRKLSKDEQNAMLLSQPVKPQILNQQILRAGTTQPIITVTQKTNAPEEGVFDITSMPIVLSNEGIMNDKLHLVITPTTNPQVIKQFQTQQHLLSSSTAGEANSSTTENSPHPGIPMRRMSNVRTKRTPSRQQLQEQQQQQQQNRQLQSQEQINQQQYSQQQAVPQLSLQQQYHQQHQLVQEQLNQQQPHQLQQQNTQLQHQQQQQQQPHQSQHPAQQQQRQQQQGHLVQQQQQFQQQQHFQQQFQLHHQSQMQQQLQEEQQFLMQQHQQQQQLLLQQQLQIQQQQQIPMQQQQQQQQQQISSEKVNQSIATEKQMGIDTRGNKYVIIKAPPNTVVMGNNPEPSKVAQRPPQKNLAAEPINTTKQRKPRQTASTGKKTLTKSPLPHMSPLPVHSPMAQTSPLPVQLSLPHELHHNPGQIIETFTNDTQPPPPALPPMPPVKKGRGRPPKPKPEVIPPAKEAAPKVMKSNGKRSSGSICEPVRQRSTRSTAANKNNKLMPYSEIQQSVGSDFVPPPIYSTSHQQSQSVSFMTTQQSIRSTASPVMCTSSMQFQMQPSSLSPQIMPQVMSCIPTERSDGPGVGYAVPSLPVPGYPQTFLLCELIDKKYREVSSRPLYLSADRTRFVEVPDEFLTEAHRKLTDCQREPNPDVLQVISSGAPHVLQPRVVQMHHEQQLQQHATMEDDVKSNDIQMQDPEQLSVDEQASALLCLQQQIVQEQLAQEQFIQQQQHQIDGDDGFLQVATIETEEVQDNLIQHLDADNVEMEEVPIDPTGQVIMNIGEQQVILDENTFYSLIGQRSASRNSYTLTPEAIQELVNTCNPTNAITAGGEYNVEICEQQEFVMHGNMLHSGEASSNILTVALDDSGLYSEEQFINSEELLQIETPDGLRYIGTATRSDGIIFQSMSTQIQAKTSETNVLLNQAPKMSIEEIPSDKSKPTFEAHPSTTATLEDCLSAIGVPPAVPTSLELPASVTNPAIVAKTRTETPGAIAMNEIIPTGLCHHPDISSLPSMGTNEQELNYDFFTSSTSTHNDKVHTNEESVIPDMGEYTVVSTGGNFDDPAR